MVLMAREFSDSRETVAHVSEFGEEGIESANFDSLERHPWSFNAETEPEEPDADSASHRRTSSRKKELFDTNASDNWRKVINRFLETSEAVNPVQEALDSSSNEELDEDSQSRRIDLDASARQDDIEKFERLKTRWQTASAHMSSTTDMAMLPVYQQIIGMGEKAIPLILNELEDDPDHWFWALKAISGEDPVPAELRGRVREMAQVWIEWGHRKGYKW